ncbi:inositol 5-phosphatase, putative, partial [Hepatocystis sp. ex Piliocolobus tephrosceles]
MIRIAEEVTIDEEYEFYNKEEFNLFFVKYKAKFICTCDGILGCIRFTAYPYLYILTKKKKVALLFGEHKIYTVSNILLIPFKSNNISNSQLENELINIFYNSINHKDLYFSYTYNLCHTVQDNYYIQREYLKGNNIYNNRYKNEYIWNYYHCKKFIKKGIFICLFVIKGYIIQSNFFCSGKLINISYIARRNYNYAGTRYRRRGISGKGYSANEVESETIVYEKNNMHAIFAYVQLRGSVPLLWNQFVNSYKPLKRPEIEFIKTDVKFACTSQHFKILLHKYGHPIIIVNLLSNNKNSRNEFNLSQEYKMCIETINKQLPKKIKIIYKHIDMRKTYKIGAKYTQYNFKLLFKHAYNNIGFFYIRNNNVISIQTGILRFNCIDCLDRTQVGQLFINIYIIIKFIRLLGSINRNYISVKNMSHLSYLYEQVGDIIAKQYAGSTAHKKYIPEQNNNFFIQSKELFTSIKRYYISSFNDLEKQNSINLFLGVINKKLEDIKKNLIQKFYNKAKSLLDWDGCNLYHYGTLSQLRHGT